MKKSYLTISLFIIFTILLTCYFVSSQIITGDTTTNDGLVIEPAMANFIKQNTAYEFQLHVFNKSNGMPLISGISCYMHLYNSTGDHLVEKETATISHRFDYSFFVAGDNFTRGIYEVKFQCNNSVMGGFNEYEFEVNPLGKETGTPEAILYVILTIAVLILFSIVLYFNIIIPWGDAKNEIGELIFISNWKYLKIGMILITYGLFVWLLNLLVGISDNFISLTLYYGFFSFAFMIFVKLSPVIFIIIFVLMAAIWIRDHILKKDLTKFGKIFKK
jgi:5-hydroxyisourate hydrolase-like protein (transthyretin family)